MKEASKNLLPEVGEKFTVLPGIGLGTCVYKGQTINLTQLTLKEAESLVLDGFDVLVPKPQSSKK